MPVAIIQGICICHWPWSPLELYFCGFSPASSVAEQVFLFPMPERMPIVEAFGREASLQLSSVLRQLYADGTINVRLPLSPM